MKTQRYHERLGRVTGAAKRHYERRRREVRHVCPREGAKWRHRCFGAAQRAPTGSAHNGGGHCQINERPMYLRRGALFRAAVRHAAQQCVCALDVLAGGE